MTAPIRFDANVNDPTERSYLEGAKALLARGDDPATVAQKLSAKVHEYRQSLAQKTDQPEALSGAGVGAGLLGKAFQGITLGGGSKLAALLESIPGIGTGESYAENLRRYEDVLKQTGKQAPVSSRVAELAGSVLPIVATGGGAAPVTAAEAAAVPEGAGMLARLANYATQGAQKAKALTAGPVEGASTLARLGNLAKQGVVYGGATGALSANKLEDVVPGALGGAVAGGVTAPVMGPLLGGAARLGAKAVGAAGRAAGLNVPTPLGQGMGLEPSDAGSRAQQMLRGALRAGGATPADVEEAIASGGPVSLMDLAEGQPAVRSLALAAKNVPNAGAAQTIETALRQRVTGAGPRIASIFSETTGIAPEEFTQTARELAAAKATNAAPLYRAAGIGQNATPHPGISPIARAVDADGNATGPTLRQLFERPSVQKAMRYGSQIAAERGEALPEMPSEPGPVASGQFSAEQWADLVKRNPQLGTGESPVPMQTLHDVKLRLDELLGYAKNRGTLPDGTGATKGMLREIQNTKNALLNVIDAHNPTYAEARAAYAGSASLEDAFTSGAEYMQSKQPAEVGRQELSELSPSEQDMWRRGAMTVVQRKVRSISANPELPLAARNVNVVQRIMGNPEDADRVKLLFGDRSFERLNEMLQPETVFPHTNQQLLRQSTTAAQQQASNTPVSAWAVRDVVSGATGHPIGMIKTAVRAAQAMNGPRRMTPEIANEVANRVTLTGQPMAQEYARIMAMPDAAARKAALNAMLGGATASAAQQP